MKYEYMNFMVDDEKKHDNGVYLMSDGESNYIGKAHRDRGFKQRYGSYVHNKEYDKKDCSGDKLFQSEESTAMYELYSTKCRFEDECEELESYFIKMYNNVHPDKKLINEKVSKKLKTVFDKEVEQYFNVEHEVNVPLLMDLDLMEQIQ